MQKLIFAIQTAEMLHRGQKRKFTGEPYIVHPFAVLDILQRYTDDIDILCAGVLHDTLEDTPYTYEQMKTDFDSYVANMVQVVTHTKELSWRRNREVYLTRLKESAVGPKMIAAADKIANLTDTIKQERKLSEDERWYYQAVADIAPPGIGDELNNLLKEGI